MCRKSRFALVVGSIAALTLVTGCNTIAGPLVQKPAEITTVKVGGTDPGSVVHAESFPNIDDSISNLGANAARIEYRSTSGIDEKPTIVSGTVFSPSKAAPNGGWPVMVVAHGTSGIEEGCAPSRSKDLMGLAPGVAAFLKLGFAVAVPDYQGLGAPGAHPYLDSTTAGYNVIDAVRALRQVFPDASDRWMAYGGSQGGAATWAANEQAGDYGAGKGITLLGTVSAVPAANFSGYVDLASDRAMTDDQMAAYIWLLQGIERTHPGFDVTPYVHGVAKQEWSTLAGCEGQAGLARNAALKNVSADDLVPSTPQAAEDLRTILKSMGLPKRRASAPMLVYYGGKDQFFKPAWTRAAIAKSCAMGSTIESVFQPNKGHGDIDTASMPEWIGKRMSGDSAPNNCQ